MPEVVIVDAIRTPIGRAVKGSLRDVRADDLAATPIRALMERNPGVDWDATDDVLMGCSNAVGEQSRNIARTAALLAGLPFEVPGVTTNRFCASSLHTIRTAFHAISAGEGDQFVAAGVEAVSRYPDVGEWALHPRLDGSEGALCDVYIPMGLTAENVAKRWGVTREEQDAWALLSQTRAVAAQASGHLDREIVPVRLEDGTLVAKDDGPRPGTTMEKLAALKPVFDPENGTVTAGNACPLNDGAAATLVMSGAKAERLGLTPRARILATSVAGVRPEVMGVGPIPAIQKLLAATGKSIEQIDVVEINEAFAAQIVPCMRELGISEQQLNPFGGAIALGHPFGMTGARIMTTLINGLEATGGRYGIESMCVAGGLGMAALIERI